jgi:hypothetical protein
VNLTINAATTANTQMMMMIVRKILAIDGPADPS